MGIGLIFLIIIVLLGLFVLMFVVGGYNALVTLRNRYKNAFSQIDVQLEAALRSDPQSGRDGERLSPATSAARSKP